MITDLSQSKKLIISVKSSGNWKVTLDFDRFKYFGVPTSNEVAKNMAEFNDKLIDRSNKFYRLFEDNVDWAESSKCSRFYNLTKYITYCDRSKLDPFIGNSIHGWIESLVNKHRLGQVKDSTCRSKINDLRAVFRGLDYPVISMFPKTSTFGRTQSEPVKGYSDNDLKKIIRLLYSLFITLYKQFIKEPQRYINLPYHTRCNTNYAVPFGWKGDEFKIHGVVSKLNIISCYLLAYYTWGNTTSLFEIRRPHLNGLTMSDLWFSMPTIKRRANKFVKIEIGENDQLNIPNHGANLFNKVMHISQLINTSNDALLLNTVIEGVISPLTAARLSDFNKWLVKTFNLRDDCGQVLGPLVSRFRASGTSRFLALTGDPLKVAITAGNSPQVVRRHYSSGNRHDNDLQIQATALVLENSTRLRSGIESAKQATRIHMQMNILPYEDFIRRLSPPSRTPSGSYCENPFSERASIENQKAIERGLLKEGEKLACADLLKCFQCEYMVIVETVEDIWCILSFRENIEESVYLHLDSLHFDKNFGEILKNINSKLAMINPKVFRAAENMLEETGRHPFWLNKEYLNLSSE